MSVSDTHFLTVETFCSFDIEHSAMFFKCSSALSRKAPLDFLHISG